MYHQSLINFRYLKEKNRQMLLDNADFEKKHPRNEKGEFIENLNTVEITDEHLRDLPTNLNDTNALKDFLLKRLREKTTVNEITQAKIGFFRDGIESSLKSRSETVRKLYLALPDLLAKAKPISYEENIKTDKKSIDKAGYQLFKVKAKLGKETYILNIKTEVMKKNKRGKAMRDDGYYFHGIESVEIEQ